MIQAKLTVTITKTADGLNEYMQIMSDDMTEEFAVNIVLIAEEIEVSDQRGRQAEEAK